MAWIKYRFKLRAEIDGVKFPDVVAVTATFELNNIPSGTLFVAVGREVQSLQVATVHKSLTGRRKSPCKVFLEMVPDEKSPGAVDKQPVGEFVIFDGYAVGRGWTRANNEAQFVFHLLHWLDDLNCSSTVSATSHPGNPADFTFGTVFPVLGVDGAGGEGDPADADAVWIATCDADRNMDAASISTDLWGEVLHKWFTKIASQDRLEVNEDGLGDVSPGLNDRAKLALERMKPSEEGKCSYSPLALDMDGANDGAVILGIQAYIGRETFSTWIHTTFWGKLVGEFGPNFMFSVAPRISDALVVPFCGPLRQEFKTIEADDYNYARVFTPMPQVLQAVGIFHAVQNNTGADGGAPENPTRLGQLAGWFSPPGDPDGMLLLKQGPGWLAEVVPEAMGSRASTGAEGVPVGDTLSPGTGEGAVGLKPDDAVKGIVQTSLMNRFAQHWYYTAMLTGSTGELSGKLRFDICPGSTVKIIAASEKFIGGGDSLGLPYFASVTSVSYSLNAEQQSCGTSFGLAHVRTETENGDDKTSVARPPLYSIGWSGCTLTDAF